MNTRRGRTPEEERYYDLQRRVWSVLAPFYGAVVVPFRPIRRLVADRVGARPGVRILDVATGTGEQAKAFARRGAEVVGVDLSPAMLRVARRTGPLANLTFQEADATALPFPDASFDVASVSFALHEMPASVRERVVREIARVTRPGGTVAVVDYGLPRGRGAWLVERLVGLYERDSYREFVHVDLPALLRAAGLEIEEDTPLLGGVARLVVARAVPR